MTDGSSGVCRWQEYCWNGCQSGASTLTGWRAGTPAVAPYFSLITSTERHSQGQKHFFLHTQTLDLWVGSYMHKQLQVQSKFCSFFGRGAFCPSEFASWKRNLCNLKYLARMKQVLKQMPAELFVSVRFFFFLSSCDNLCRSHFSGSNLWMTYQTFMGWITLWHQVALWWLLPNIE